MRAAYSPQSCSGLIACLKTGLSSSSFEKGNFYFPKLGLELPLRHSAGISPDFHKQA